MGKTVTVISVSRLPVNPWASIEISSLSTRWSRFATKKNKKWAKFLNENGSPQLGAQGLRVWSSKSSLNFILAMRKSWPEVKLAIIEVEAGVPIATKPKSERCKSGQFSNFFSRESKFSDKLCLDKGLSSFSKTTLDEKIDKAAMKLASNAASSTTLHF